MEERTFSESTSDKVNVEQSIVTATYNAAAVLPNLIKSLQAQTDQDFEWVVADGGSTDGTLELLAEAAKTMRVRVDSQPDFGIYDALNRAVNNASGNYYLVVGADDWLESDAVDHYKKACFESGADLVTASIMLNGRIHKTKERWEWLYGMSAHVSGHSVGVAIRKGLHDKYGMYSRKLPIAADHVFILKAIHGGAKVKVCDFVAGEFCMQGASGGDVLGTPAECMRAQVMVGHNLWLQLILFCLRVIRRSIRYATKA